MADVKTCVVDLNHGRMRLDCRQGMTLFAALRMNKIYMPTGCGARGLCGQCKVTLLNGEANMLTDSEVRLIPEDERAHNRRLACQLRLSGDIAVEMSDYIFQAKPHQATLASVTPLTHDIKRFSFTVDSGDSLPHVAGQFLNIAVKIPDSKVQAIRCFSFATPSSIANCADIIVRLNPKGVLTPYMFDGMQVGDQVTLTAPYGDFHLRAGDAPCIWIAGGSGLSPFLGMVQEMIDHGNTSRKVHLFFGAVKPNDLYYAELLYDIAKKHPWFTFTPALSGEERIPLCQDYGLITDVVARHVDDASQSEGYLCGSPGMIGACLKVLSEKGMKRENIYYDRF